MFFKDVTKDTKISILDNIFKDGIYAILTYSHMITETYYDDYDYENDINYNTIINTIITNKK